MFSIEETDIAYDIIKYLHTNPNTKHLTNGDWIKILSCAIFCLGMDYGAGQREALAKFHKASDIELSSPEFSVVVQHIPERILRGDYGQKAKKLLESTINKLEEYNGNKSIE